MALGSSATPSEAIAAHDCVCRHGVQSPRAEGAYPRARARIGVILDGAFLARSRQGNAVVGAGALLLGNAGAEYEYRHLDDGGDRSVVFDYDAALFDDLGAAGFRRATVPASSTTAHAVALAAHALWTADPEDLRDAALAVAAVVVTHARDAVRPARDATDPRPILQTLRYIEAHHADDCSLDTLAAVANLSAFHLVRRFRAATGQTPRQVVIATRLRASAHRLRTTQAPILDIALDVGFGDLSHFHASFARAFGVSPGRYRRQSTACITPRTSCGTCRTSAADPG